MESTEDWMRRIGSRAAHEKRVELRLAGVVNAPIRKTGDLNTLGRPHSLYCKCEVCVPDWLKEEMKSWPVVTKGMYEAAPRKAKPVTVIASTSAEPSRRRSKWEQRGTSGN